MSSNIDLKYITSEMGLDEEHAIELLDDLSNFLKEKSPFLKAAYDNNDLSSCRRLAFEIKGVSGNLGIKSIRDLALEIHKSIFEHNILRLGDLIDQIIMSSDEFIKDLQELKGE